MNPEQPWETTMRLESRVMLRVSVKDAAKTNDLCTVLMGEDVEPLWRYIEERVVEVTNLDVEGGPRTAMVEDTPGASHTEGMFRSVRRIGVPRWAGSNGRRN